MSSSRRTRRRRQQQSLRRHRFKLESLEKRYALDGDGLSVSMNADYVATGTAFPTDYGPGALANSGAPTNFFLPQHDLAPFSNESDSSPGLVITSLNLQGGKLWYSTNAGSTWTEITSASEASGTVLLDDGNTRLHYEPTAGFSGQVTDVFSFQPYDFASIIASGTSQFNATNGSSIQTVGSYGIDHTLYPHSFGDGGKISLFGDGTRAAAIHDDGLEILDISNPSSIQRIGITPGVPPEYGLYSDVRIAGDESSVFINPTIPTTNGSFVVNLADQSSPQLIPYSSNPATFAWTLTSNADGSMVVMGTTGGAGDPNVEGDDHPNLYFFDTTDRASPSLLSTLRLTVPSRTVTYGVPPYEYTYVLESDLEVHSLTMSPDGNTLYVSCISEMFSPTDVPLFFVVDISILTQPRVIAKVDNTDLSGSLPVHCLSPDGSTLYVAGDNSVDPNSKRFLSAYNVSNPSSPTQIWRYEVVDGAYENRHYANEIIYDQGTETIYVAFDTGVRAFEINSGGVVSDTLISTGVRANGLALSANGQFAYVMEHEQLAVYAINNSFSVSIDVASAPEPEFTPVESEGTVTLNKDSSGKLYADSMPIYDIAGNHINENIGAQDGWVIGAVDTFDGINRMLVYRSGQAHYWELTSAWRYQSHTAFYADGTTEYFDIESNFNLDVNQDGFIGALMAAPNPPANLIALAGNSEVSLTWDAPLSDGGTAVTGYALSYQAGGGGWVTVDAGLSPSYTVLGLTNGVSYDFRVAAVNSVGQGLWSTTVNALLQANSNAPVLNPSASLQLNSIVEDAGIPVGQVGTLVSDLIDTGSTHNNFSDIDGGLPGIVVTETNLQGGTLYYSTNDGTTWGNVGSVSEMSALVLYADNSTRLAYAPAASFHGDITDLIKIRAWDRTGGYANGATNVKVFTDVGSIVTPGTATAISLSPNDEIAYVADLIGGLQIVDVASSSSPLLLGSLETIAAASSITLSPDGKTAYIAVREDGLQVIDVSSPTNPISLGSINPPTSEISSHGTGSTISNDGDTVYLADGDAGVHIIDVTTPTNPTVLGSIDTPYFADELKLSTDGNLLYVADYASGLQIIDVSDSANSSIVGSYGSITPVPEQSVGVTLSSDGNTAYLANGRHGLEIIDVSNPTAPLLIGEINASVAGDYFGAWNVRLSADGHKAYVASFSGIWVVDIREPASPSLVAMMETSGRDIQFSNDKMKAFIAGGNGLHVIDVSQEFSVTFDTVSIAVLADNSAPTLDPITDIILPEDSLVQFIRLEGIASGGSETRPVRVTATSSNPSLLLHPAVISITELNAGERLVAVAPLPDQYGVATITVTVEDGGLDLNLDTADDNATFSQAFDVAITPDTDNPPSLVTPHGKMFIHQTLSGEPLVSYQLPAVNINGEAINGLLNRITATSGNTELIPDPTVLYASADVPSSLSFSPVANANGSATLSIQVEDGGPDNDFATSGDNRQATHQVEVNVLEIISNQGSAVLAKDSSDSLYVNTQPVIYNQQQVPQAFFGSSVVSADTSDSENALMLKPLGADAEDPPTHRLLTDETWRINGIFNSLQNASSPVLDLSGREVSVPLNIVAVAGAYEINGVNNPTLIVRRGQTYTFNLNTAGHPFYLQTAGGDYQSANVYDSEFTGNSQTTGEHQWVVPEDAPDELYYQCEFHPVMFGKIIVVD